MIRCENKYKNPPLPAGMPVEAARNHPRYAHLLIPGAQCTLELDHAEPYRDGGLIWHDPPLLLVDGQPVSPLTRAESDRLQRIGTVAPTDSVVSEWSD